MNRIPIKSSPRLFDKAIGEIQTQIGRRISWLDHVFGLCEVITEVKHGKRVKTANIYTGNGQYAQVAPCSELGNFCFFMLKDPQSISAPSSRVVSSPFYAIFWYNIEKVSSSVDERNTEAIKEEILQCLSRIRTPHIIWSKVYERPENIFSDFSYDFTSNQFLMYPYAGIRIEGEIFTDFTC